MKFGAPIRHENSVLLPLVQGRTAYAALRRMLLLDGDTEPRPMDAHVTIIHPRNGLCTDEIFAQIERRLQPFTWTFRQISLIEQRERRRLEDTFRVPLRRFVFCLPTLLAA